MKRNSINIQELGDAPKIQKYEAKPVQNYGLGLLKKMGFTEQRGIGFNKQNALHQPLVLKPRPKGLGLGAKAENAVEEKPVFSKKDFIKIKSQLHEGMIGIIKKVKNDEQIITIELGISGTEIKIKFQDAENITESEFNETKERLTKEFKQRNEQNNQKKKKRLKWVIPNIRCKVIDKLSPYYLKKVIVSELLGQREFQCIYVSETGEKKYLKQLTEKQLQTVVPKPQGFVLVLDKKFRGKKAKILERNKDKSQVTVQILETLEIQKFNEDNVSEFVSF